MIAGYVRVSTDDQDPSSQVSKLMGAGVRPELIFIDAGISGTVRPDRRAAYQRLLKQIEAGAINEVWVTELSRLGRDTLTTLEEYIRLNRAGVRVHTLSPNERVIEETQPEFKPLVISALQLAADIERRAISTRTLAGLATARARGRKGGRPSIVIPWDRIEEFKARGLSERSAVLASGIKLSTFYRKKKGAGAAGANH